MTNSAYSTKPAHPRWASRTTCYNAKTSPTARTATNGASSTTGGRDTAAAPTSDTCSARNAWSAVNCPDHPHTGRPVWARRCARRSLSGQALKERCRLEQVGRDRLRLPAAGREDAPVEQGAGQAHGRDGGAITVYCIGCQPGQDGFRRGVTAVHREQQRRDVG